MLMVPASLYFFGQVVTTAGLSPWVEVDAQTAEAAIDGLGIRL